MRLGSMGRKERQRVGPPPQCCSDYCGVSYNIQTPQMPSYCENSRICDCHTQSRRPASHTTARTPECARHRNIGLLAISGCMVHLPSSTAMSLSLEIVQACKCLPIESRWVDSILPTWPVCRSAPGTGSPAQVAIVRLNTGRVQYRPEFHNNKIDQQNVQPSASWCVGSVQFT